MSARKWLVRITSTIIILVVLFAAALGYAYFIEPHRLVITQANLGVPNFDPQLDGLRIVAISDVHAGSNGVTEERLKELVAWANQENPDIIVLLGDYISEAPGSRSRSGEKDLRDRSGLRMPLPTIATNLTGFKARYGTFAVIGNHDWWYDENAVRQEFERAGIKILENEIVALKTESGSVIQLWGIEDYWKMNEVPRALTYDQIADKRNIIAITHNPDSLLKAPDGISILLAGHSHGGQVNFPIYGPYPFVNDVRFMKGEAVVEGKHVFVTSGVGCTGPQIRFRVPPEIAVVDLHAAK